MKEKRGKIFISKKNGKKCFSILDYSRSENSYYGFLSNKEKQGFYQIPISSKTIIVIIQKLNKMFSYDLKNISFLQEDEDFYSDISSILKEKNINNTINKLNFLYSEDCIEIKEVELQSNNLKSFAIIKNNGLIKVDEKHYKIVTDAIKEYFYERK